ncbi:MAG: hypothetical protein K6E35_08780 [Bacteroidales bacterium]|nr:hypothetical protein [Bacteroidales bacterium]
MVLSEYVRATIIELDLRPLRLKLWPVEAQCAYRDFVIDRLCEEEAKSFREAALVALNKRNKSKKNVYESNCGDLFASVE